MRANKSLGQNFLQDLEIAKSIAYSLALSDQDIVLEIGGGQGALTDHLQGVKKLIVLEFDTRMIQKLNERFTADNIQIIQGDALKTDWSDYFTHYPRLKIVGNLPYNIGTKLVLSLLSAGSIHHSGSFVFMLQKEVAKHFCAQVGDSDYGRLSLYTQFYADTHYLMDVPPEAFSPRPAVHSGVFQLQTHQRYAHYDSQLFQRLTRLLFQYPRKSVANNLKGAIAQEKLAPLESIMRLRPHQLDIKTVLDLMELLS